MRCGVVERLAQLQFKEAALFFDDEDGLQAGGEIGDESRIEWKRHAEFCDAHAEGVEFLAEDTEIAEALHEVVIRLAGGGDPETSGVASAEHLIYGIHGGEFANGIETPIVHFALELQSERDDEARVGMLLVPGWDGDGGPVGIEFNCGTAIADVGDHFHRNPSAGETRKRDGEEAEVEDLLGIAGIEDGDAKVVKAEIALVRDG